MNRATLSLLTIAMVLAGVSAGLAFMPSAEVETNYWQERSTPKVMVLKPKANGYIKIVSMNYEVIKVTAKADRGKSNIRIVDAKGKTVASGVGKVTFESGEEKTTYKTEIFNKTNKTQKVTVSYEKHCERGQKDC